MFNLFNTTRKIILFACCFVLVLFAVALTLNVKTSSQQLQVPSQKDKEALLKQIEESTDYPFNVDDNENSPLKITNAKVKEISGAEFTKLTGKTTNLTTVTSVPEIQLMNVSDKTIKAFFVAVRDVKNKSVRGFTQFKVSIAPGETYTVHREHFSNPESVSVSDENGVRPSLNQPKLDSEKLWLNSEKSPDVFTLIARVLFEDNSQWKVEEGGKIR